MAGGWDQVCCRQEGAVNRERPLETGLGEIMRSYLRSKIHKATVTAAEIDYVGSITIDEDLIDRARFEVGEKVLVVSIATGARLETYVIPGERGSGVIAMNGAAAHLIRPGEEIIIMGFELADSPPESTVVLVDGENLFKEFL